MGMRLDANELPPFTRSVSEPDETILGQLPTVHSLGRLLFDPCWAERFHVDERNELLHVRRGAVHLETREAKVSAGPGDLLLLPAGTDHRDVFDPELGLEVFMIQFAWPGMPALSPFLAQQYRLAVPPHARQEIASLLVQIERDIAAGVPLDQLLVRSRLLTALLFVLREFRQDGAQASATGQRANRQRSRQIMLAARDYLDQHYQEPISLEAIADALHVSPFHLSHVFSQESDFSLFTYLTNLRMERARELLDAGAHRVAEVAEAVGFESSSYFSKVFRKYFGYAPSERLKR